ncbi:hypothetical protein AKJ51_05060 [candidate division MSBL1 archaeon SCGC-AAA382A20]|uniref:Ubiquinone biosynthesis protein UbiA n=1 Tax=candidate division MSBL1 archaeon SCGC-AAA382A20 TaxID=1698280 RepID=A0A133VG68_9EURY|nr:hypothetical protein AKJ51_05060 [candidate division MSBL1 archaeon SCGC-AAA382A20]
MEKELSKKVFIWIKELRVPFFTCTIVPVFLGATVAWYKMSIFNPVLFSLTLLGTLSIHAGSNMIDDYLDHKSGCDSHLQYENLESTFFGGSRILVEGKLKPKNVYKASILTLAIGGVIGAFLTILRGWEIIILGGIGMFSGYFHAKHISTRGLGELSLFLNFGPLIVLGSYFVQVQKFGIEPLLASLPIGILMFCILLIN